MEKAKVMSALLVGVGLAVLMSAAPVLAGLLGEEPQSIPNPGTLVLLTSGIVGAAWWLSRKR